MSAKNEMDAFICYGELGIWAGIVSDLVEPIEQININQEPDSWIAHSIERTSQA